MIYISLSLYIYIYIIMRVYIYLHLPLSIFLHPSGLLRGAVARVLLRAHVVARAEARERREVYNRYYTRYTIILYYTILYYTILILD